MSDIDEAYDCMKQAEKEWEVFKVTNNFRYIDVKTCETCKHCDFGYEGERDCEHPEKFNEELGNWSVTDADHLAVCDKWEANE